MPNVSNKVHKFPFGFIYDMGELMGVGGGEVLDYLKSCNKHIYSYRNYQHPGMHFYICYDLDLFHKKAFSNILSKHEGHFSSMSESFEHPR